MGTDLENKICELCAAYVAEFTLTHKRTGAKFEICKKCAERLLKTKKDATS